MTNPTETFLSRSQQARRWSVSKRSVERWGENEELSLPTEIEINGRHYRRLSELEAWERSRAVQSCGGLAPGVSDLPIAQIEGAAHPPVEQSAALNEPNAALSKAALGPRATGFSRSPAEKKCRRRSKL